MGYIIVKDQLVLFDNEDLDIVLSRDWTIQSAGYVYSGADEPTLLHRKIMGVTSRHQIVDHINFDKLDNRKCNLRVVNKSLNSRHRQSASRVWARTYQNGTTFYKAAVDIKGKRFHLGSFRTKRRAEIIAAYNTKRLLAGLSPIALKRKYGRPSPKNPVVRVSYQIP